MTFQDQCDIYIIIIYKTIYSELKCPAAAPVPHLNIYWDMSNHL